ncbi:MAG: peptidylprolyl isomerase [Pseudonocardia sp.]|uniref:peptidylprolyl isomerase n=1 Tax=unclassified Pseudonocardia TaxID=2619320 RepID=UPI00086EBCF7|nr:MULTISPECIES: peptidylprolyl isomerase [unclassified Pseudonocardia]MBN9112786.1 peptidylprolyl isomerase [Pseudonocardia sp.]ODU03585.1 MAG: cyclophilin [Pseudonocardia sp. SCN 72-51]ODV00368.1 MAG: cyclophilin [Pseudonocardia sp. SCN 73-27]
MATNQMRREAAKRKLASQQKRRAEQARRRKQVATITTAVVVVLVVVGVVLLTTIGSGGGSSSDQAAAPATECSYPAETGAAKPNNPPSTDSVPDTGTVGVSLTTSAGPIGLTLDRAEARCTVNSFTSLVSQKYYDDTVCHRLTTGEGLKVLQCGDPTGTGQGGPGYTIPDEPPTNLAPAAGGSGAVVYPRGTVAMAKTAAPNSGGSQFFLVYGDSTLPPDYTVFGTVDAAGLATLDKIAAAGDDGSNGTGDGKPKTEVRIETATLAS